LTLRGHKIETQRQFPVFYRGELIGSLVPDMIVDDLVIVDPKVVSSFVDTPIDRLHQVTSVMYRIRSAAQ